MALHPEISKYLDGLRDEFYERCSAALGPDFSPKALFTHQFPDRANEAAKTCAKIAYEVFEANNMHTHYVRDAEHAGWWPIRDEAYADHYKTPEAVYKVARRRVAQNYR